MRILPVDFVANAPIDIILTTANNLPRFIYRVEGLDNYKNTYISPRLSALDAVPHFPQKPMY
jgi:hypothetical protein